VGFIPLRAVPRLMLSGWACFVALALALLRIAIR
jgi:hypothetical protein